MSAPTKPSDSTPTPTTVATAAATGGKLMTVLVILSSANVGATGFVVTRVLKSPPAHVARTEAPKRREAASAERIDGGDKDEADKADGGKGVDGGKSEGGEHGDEEAAAGAEEKKAPAAGPFVPLDAFLVNLNEPGSGRYLKASVEVEVADGAASDDMNKQKRSIRDDLLRYLSSLAVTDTLGESAKDKIKQAMVMRIGKQIGGKERVRRLFFTEFMVQ